MRVLRVRHELESQRRKLCEGEAREFVRELAVNLLRLPTKMGVTQASVDTVHLSGAALIHSLLLAPPTPVIGHPRAGGP